MSTPRTDALDAALTADLDRAEAAGAHSAEQLLHIAKTAMIGYGVLCKELESELQRARAALRNLTLEAGAIVGMCGEEIRQCSGNTNLAVLNLRITEAQTVWGEAAPEPPREGTKMNWSQPICSACYAEREPERQPVRVKAADREVCCDCGRATDEGIYYRVDPRTVNYAS